jgi:hypothetical protein
MAEVLKECRGLITQQTKSSNSYGYEVNGVDSAVLPFLPLFSINSHAALTRGSSIQMTGVKSVRAHEVPSHAMTTSLEHHKDSIG